MIDNVSLAKRKLFKEKMLALGFDFVDGEYFYRQGILQGEFALIVTIDKNNVANSSVVEVDTNELYTLYNVKDSVGGFVGQMRNAYNSLMEQVINDCSAKDVYKSNQALAIVQYIDEKYGDKLEFLWDDDNAIARNKSSNKWYLVLMIVAKSKLGLNTSDKVEIVNLHIDCNKLPSLVDNERFFVGYHMNKKHWISIKLDNSVATQTIFALIDESYQLANKR